MACLFIEQVLVKLLAEYSNNELFR